MIINGRVATDAEAAFAVEVKPEDLVMTTSNPGLDAAVDAVLNNALEELARASQRVGFGNPESAMGVGRNG